MHRISKFIYKQMKLMSQIYNLYDISKTKKMNSQSNNRSTEQRTLSSEDREFYPKKKTNTTL